MTIYTDPQDSEDYGFVFPPHGHRPPEIRYPRPCHRHRHHHPLVSTPLGMGPRGPKGDTFSFDDLTDEQLAELREDVASVYHRKLESVYTTTSENTSQIPIPWDSFDPEKDMLFVRIEGLWLHANEYTVSDGNIVLTTPIASAGTAVGITMITTVAMSVEDIEDLHGEDGFSPTVTMVRQDDGTLLSITDADGTTSALIPDGAIGPTGQTGPVGPAGPQGLKGDKGDKGDVGPVGPKGQKGDKGDKGDAGLQGPKGDTGDQGPQGVTGPQGPQGETGPTGPQGPDGVSPTASVERVEGGALVTVTDASGTTTAMLNDAEVTEGSVTDAMLAPDGIKAQVAQLWWNQLKATLTGDLLTASDAYAAPPMALTVDGRSTQDGTPTPDAPVPIVSMDSVELHASADGATDYGNWPVTLYDGTLRSLPDGTKDELHLSYLRPSTREGWAWYDRELVQRVTPADMGDLAWANYYGNRIFYAGVSGMMNGTSDSLQAMCEIFTPYKTASLAWFGSRAPENSIALLASSTASIGVKLTPETAYESAAAFKAAMSGIYAYVPLATPVTTTLDPIELPVLPAPNCTVWSDPSTGLRMEYVRDTNLAFAQLEAALADLATS